MSHWARAAAHKFERALGQVWLPCGSSGLKSKVSPAAFWTSGSSSAISDSSLQSSSSPFPARFWIGVDCGISLGPFNGNAESLFLDSAFASAQSRSMRRLRKEFVALLSADYLALADNEVLA
jgi:hypothetical protein